MACIMMSSRYQQGRVIRLLPHVRVMTRNVFCQQMYLYVDYKVGYKERHCEYMLGYVARQLYIGKQPVPSLL